MSEKDKKKKGHIVLTVKNLARSRDWYNVVLARLGFTVGFEDETNIYYSSEEWSLYLAIFQGEEEFKNDTFNRYRVGFHHFALPAESKEAVDEFHQFLLENNITVTEKPQHYPDYGDSLYYAVFFSDPDGLRFEIFFEGE